MRLVNSLSLYIETMQETGEVKSRKFVVDDFDEKAIFLCQFCGGQSCSHQDHLSNKKMPNGIQGLNSNWITPGILAMQRPSERLIKEFNIYQQFKDQNIKAVLNLQEPGEHPYCGDGIIPHVGFSYIPENFYHHGIKCFSECWEDMTSTTFQHMMRIMNIFHTVLVVDEGKISVHCHAGRGRTLLVICSWIIYHDRMPVDRVIQLAREKRQGVLASRNQIVFLKYFEEELKKRWVSFGIDQYHRSFSEFVEWQTVSLLKKQKKRLNSTSIVHFRILLQLRKMAKQDPTNVIQAFLNPSSFYFKSKWGQKNQQQLTKLKDESNVINFQHYEEEKDPRILTELLYDYYDSLPFTLLTSISIECLKQQSQKGHQNDSKLKLLSAPSVVHNFGVETVSTILDLVHFFRDLLEAEKQKQKSDTSNKDVELEQNNVNSGIQWTLYMRLSLLLLFKRKYFPQLFSGQTLRECKLYKLGPKVTKVVGKQAIFLSQFLRDLSKQLPLQHTDIEDLVFRVKKVESNLYYLLKEGNHGNSLSGEAKETVYESARVKR